MVMPLWDDSPLKLPKWLVVTWGLIVLNVAVFIIESVSPHYEYLAMAFAMTPGNITGPPILPPLVPPYLTLITS